MEDLYARFLPQFIAVARTRIAAALTNAQRRDQASAQLVVGELHALAGEAGLLGLSHIVPLARDCEAKAKALRANGDGAEAEGLLAGLQLIEQAIERLAASAGAA
jgi:HPt (histidine-containing phosphotransfer) domain-containing protein